MKYVFTTIFSLLFLSNLFSNNLKIRYVELENVSKNNYRELYCNILVQYKLREIYINSYSTELTWSKFELCSEFGYFNKNILHLPASQQPKNSKIWICIKHKRNNVTDTFYLEIPHIKSIEFNISKHNKFYPSTELFFSTNCIIDIGKDLIIEKMDYGINNKYNCLEYFNFTINDVPFKQLKFKIPDQNPANRNKFKLKISHKFKPELVDSFEFEINYKINEIFRFVNENTPPKAQNGEKGEIGYLGEKGGKGGNGADGLKGYEGHKIFVNATLLTIDVKKYVKYNFYIKDSLVKTLIALADSHHIIVYSIGGKGGEGGDGGRGGKGNKVYCNDCISTYGMGGDGGNGGNGGTGGMGGKFEMNVSKEALIYVKKGIDFVSEGGEGGNRGAGGLSGLGEPKFIDSQAYATSGAYNGKFGEAGKDGKKGETPNDILIVNLVQ